jgi:hypothetical protein
MGKSQPIRLWLSSEEVDRRLLTNSVPNVLIRTFRRQALYADAFFHARTRRRSVPLILTMSGPPAFNRYSKDDSKVVGTCIAAQRFDLVEKPSFRHFAPFGTISHPI